jgi:hypothetical protein
VAAAGHLDCCPSIGLLRRDAETSLVFLFVDVVMMHD